jgi:ATP-dependent RNA helicase DDX51/DBP6
MNCSSTVGLLEPLSDLTATGGKGLPTTTIPAPLTSHPDVPDDSKFMKQGVDPAFARAQLVDPHLTTPLPPDEEQSADIGLSAKTLRRLKDLGITELFAGA